MSDFVKRLHEERLNTWEQAKALLDHAAEESRDLSAEEDAQYRSMSGRIDEIDARVLQVQEDQKRAAASEEAFASLLAQRPAAPAARGAVDPNTELRAFARGERGRAIDVRPETRTVGKAQPPGTTGGNTVRTDFYTTLVQHLIENSGVLQAGPTVLNTAGGEALQIPKTATHSNSAGIVAENEALTNNEPTFGMVTLNAFKYGFLMQLTHELLNDTSVDLMGYMSMQAGRALGNGFGRDLVLGTGAGVAPNGIANAVTQGVTGVTPGAGAPEVGAPRGDDLIDLFYSVIAPYRNSTSCGWLMRDATVGKIRKLKDANGVYIWQPGLLVGAPDTILGKPVHTDPNVAAVAAGAESIYFGDFSTYFVRRVEAIRFERSDDFAFDTDVVTFRTILRGDGNLIDTTGSIKAFTGGAAS